MPLCYNGSMKIPSIDSSVEVTTKYRNTYIFSNEEFMYYTTRGRVIPNARWIDGESFSVQTNNPKNPVSIISTKNVHKMVVLSGNTIPIRKFQVKGSKGKYMIIKNNNHYSCECIGFKYTSKCKHITAVIKSLTKSTA